MSGRWTRLAAGVVAATVVAVGLPAVAQAGPVQGVLCTAGSWRSELSPAATSQPQSVTMTNSFAFGNCVSLTNPAIKSGTALTVKAIANFTCLSILSPITNTYVIKWNTGQQSTIVVTTYIAGVGAGAAGNVVSGVFAGKFVIIPLVGFPVDAATACPANGLSVITGTSTLDFM